MKSDKIFWLGVAVTIVGVVLMSVPAGTTMLYPWALLAEKVNAPVAGTAGLRVKP